MEELSIEEKAKRYNEALEKAKTLKECSTNTEVVGYMDELFPELKESEDERVRKELLAVIDDLILPNEQHDRFVTWIEKQGKQTPEAVNKEKADNGIKIEPKFKIGDWVVCNDDCSVHQIKGCFENLNSHTYDYELTEGGHISSNDVNKWHLWTIEDAKDGDVLAEDSCIFMIQKLGDNSTAAKTYCALYDDGEFNNGSILYFDIDSTKPATNEQCDLLEKAMKEADFMC